MKVWQCRIMVPDDVELPLGFDAPPRQAAIKAVEKAGVEVIACFSGWGNKETVLERAIINDDDNDLLDDFVKTEGGQ